MGLQAIGPGRLVEQNIVCLAHLPWDGPWKAYHQIISRLADANRVFCIDPPSALRQALDSVRGRATIPPLLRRVSANLYAYHPPWWLSRPRVRWAEQSIQPIRMRHARWISRRLGFFSSVLWVFDPLLAPFVDLFSPRFLVYHVTDNYIEFLSRSATQQRAKMARHHELLLRRADVVFAVSPQLHEQSRQVNESTYLIPNAVDFDRFQRAMADSHVPEDIRGIPRPIIGYVGHIESNLDVGLVRWVAACRPDWSLVFIGPADATVREELMALARRHPNVYYLGAKRLEELPYYTKSLDAAMMIDRERTDGDSIKLYEYLACGKPVVSLDADSIQRVKNLVWRANDGTEFVRCLEQALHEQPSLAEARIAFARGETWQTRLETVTSAIERHLSQPRSFQQLRVTRGS